MSSHKIVGTKEIKALDDGYRQVEIARRLNIKVYFHHMTLILTLKLKILEFNLFFYPYYFEPLAL